MNKLNYHLYKIYAIITLVILQFILTASAFSQNKALRMDDLDDYIDLSPWAEQLIFNSPMTLEFWFRPNFDHKCTSGEACYSSILAVSNGVQPSSIGKFLFIGYGNSLGNFINEQISIGRRNGSSFNTSIVGSTDAGTFTNEWHHYSIVINGTSG
ncbi:MAG: hypothetical protein IPJ06_19425 [Saprospiraceae bacterium]|nr:hypothetical protein [Saprospiraceae bacterium]